MVIGAANTHTHLGIHTPKCTNPITRACTQVKNMCTLQQHIHTLGPAPWRPVSAASWRGGCVCLRGSGWLNRDNRLSLGLQETKKESFV